MILFWEIKNKNFIDTENQKTQEGVLVEALEMYKLLFSLDSEFLEDIKRIAIFSRGPEIELAKVRKVIEKFTPFLDNFEEEIYFDLFDRLPPNESLIEEDKSKKIVKLINKIDFISEESVREIQVNFYNDGCCFLISNLSEDSSRELDDNSKTNVFRLNYNTSSFFPNVYPVDINRFQKIKNELEKVDSKSSLEGLNLRELRKFSPPTYLENFEDDFLNELEQLIERNACRIFLLGEEDFTAIRSSNHLLKSKPVSYYDLKYGLKEIEVGRNAIVILNIDSLKDSSDIYELSNKLSTQKEDKAIVIEGIVNYYKENFNIYERLYLPNIAQIKLKITGIFLSLLTENRKIKEAYHLIYPIIKGQLLNKLMEDCTDLEILEKIVQQLSKIKIQDLTQNPEFWLRFYDEYEKCKLSVLKDEPISKMHLKIIKGDLKWNIIYNGEEKGFNFKGFNSIYYLIVVIEYYIKYNKPIDVLTLRKAIIKLEHKKDWENKIKKLESPKDKFQLIENERRNCSDRFKIFRNDSFLSKFYSKYFHYHNTMYYFTPSSDLEFSIENFELPQDLI